MRKNKKLWSWALAGALAVSNLSAVATPLTSIVVQAADGDLSWDTLAPAYVTISTASGKVNLGTKLLVEDNNQSAPIADPTTATWTLGGAGSSLVNISAGGEVSLKGTSLPENDTVVTVSATVGGKTTATPATITIQGTKGVPRAIQKQTDGTGIITKITSTDTIITRPNDVSGIDVATAANAPNYVGIIKSDKMTQAEMNAAIKTQYNYKKAGSTVTKFDNGVEFNIASNELNLSFPDSVDEGEYTVIVAQFGEDGPTVDDLAALAGDTGTTPFTAAQAEYFTVEVDSKINLDEMKSLVSLEKDTNKTTLSADATATHAYTIAYEALDEYRVADSDYTYNIELAKNADATVVAVDTAFTAEAYNASTGSLVVKALKPGSSQLVVNAIKSGKKTEIATLDLTVEGSIDELTFEELNDKNVVAAANTTYTFDKTLTVIPTIKANDGQAKNINYDVVKASDTKTSLYSATDPAKFNLTRTNDSLGADAFNKKKTFAGNVITPGASVKAGDYLFVATVAGQEFTWPFTVVTVPDGAGSLIVRGKDGIDDASSIDVDVPGKLSLYQKVSGVTKAVDASKVTWKLNSSTDDDYIDLNESTGEFTVKKHKATGGSTIVIDATYEVANGVKNATPATYTLTTKAGTFELSKTATTIVAGESETIKATFGGKDITGVKWTTDDSQVATVSDGTISALKAGSATITATYKDSNNKNYEKTITVTVSAQTYKLVGADGKAITGPKGVNPGEQLQLAVKTTNGADYEGTVVWKTGNDQIATVDDNGLVTVLEDAKTTTKVSASPAANVSAVITAYDSTGKNVLKDSTGKNVAITLVAIGSFYKASDVNGKLTNETVDTAKATEYKANLYKDEALEVTVTKDGQPVSGKWTVKPGTYIKLSGDKIVATKVGVGEKAEFTPEGETAAKISIAISVVADDLTLKSDDMTLTSTAALTYTAAPVEVDSTYAVKAFFGTEDISDKVVWSTTDESVVSVANGVITTKAIATGVSVSADYQVNGASVALATITFNVKAADEATIALKDATAEAIEAAEALAEATAALDANAAPTKDDIAKVEALAKDAEEKATAVQDLLDAGETKDKSAINDAKAAIEVVDAATADVDDVVKGANDKIAAAEKEAAKQAAIDAAEKAAKAAVEAPTEANIKAAQDAVAAAKTAGATDDELKAATENISKAETAKKEADQKKADDEKKAKEEADKEAAKTAAIDAANKAAEAAKAAPTEANIKAADDAIAAAKTAGATDDELKAATDAAAAAKAAKADADKKSDGSTTGKAPAAGTELKDATTGKETGYVVSNPEKFEVSFKGTADMSGTCAIPATVKDSAGNEYKVTSIAANAFADSDVTQINITGNITSIDPKAFANSKVKYISVKDAKLSKSAFKSLLKAKKGTQIKITGKNKKTNIKNLKKSKAYKKGRVKLVKKFNKKTSKKK